MTTTDDTLETFDALFKTTNKQGQIIEGLLERIEALEAKLSQAEEQNSYDRLMQQIAGQDGVNNDEADLWDGRDRF